MSDQRQQQELEEEAMAAFTTMVQAAYKSGHCGYETISKGCRFVGSTAETHGVYKLDRPYKNPEAA